jgi:ParB family transcriptional regulator, chromosome partitioning protein
MLKVKSGLGRGLDALIPPLDDETPGVREVIVDVIVPNPQQPRQRMDPAALQELADSIKRMGVIQPLIVCKVAVDSEAALAGARYQLIAGERRLTAARLAGLETVPVMVREATPLQMLELALVENVQRADLNPLEEAAAYQQLITSFSLTQDQVAERVGKNRVTVTNSLRLLGLPDALKEALMDEKISEGHARALLGLGTAEMQVAALKEVIRRSLSVHATEEYVRRLKDALLATREAEPAEAARKDPHLSALEDDFRRTLGTKVELTRSSRGGKVTIFFYSDEELEGIYSTIVKA